LYIQTSQRDWITNGEFDAIQHEHQNFFTVNSMARLLLRHGLVIDNIELPDVHGSSYVFVVKIQKNKEYHSGAAENVFLYEKDLGLYELETYKKYGQRVEGIIDDLNSIITDYAMDDWRVIGYGAAAKGNVLINAASELSFYLDYIIDDNEWKQGLLSPGGDTPVVHPSVLNVESGKLLIVILAWNMKDEIIQRIKDMVAFEVEEVHFLTVFPTLKLETYNGEPV